MERSVIGIDVAKDCLDVFLISGTRLAYKQFANDLGGYRHLVAWLKHTQVDPGTCLSGSHWTVQ